MTQTSSDLALASKTSRIVIVGGGGTMGSSTALHLVRRGFTDITIMDVYPIPSDNSAGNDMNKIAGADNIDSFGGTSDSAWDTWVKDPVFSPYAHSVGKLDLTENEGRASRLKAKYEKFVALGRKDFEWLENEDDIRKRAPHLKDADIKASLYCATGGWVAARDAIDSVGRELQKAGVKTVFGPSGNFDSLVFDNDGKTVKGVKGKDGSVTEADLVVLAAGAWSPALVDLQGQCVSKCWVYAHIQLTPEEAAALKGIPTVYNDKYGFFFEPRVENNLLKLCNEFPGYTHYVQHQPFDANEPKRISVPRSHADFPSDTMPNEALDEIKRLVRIALPHLAGRELINQAMCWCTDTADANWLLCEHPKWKGLVLATGDSGHTFKMLPIVGGQVADLIEGKLSDEKRHLWRWRPNAGDPNGTGRGGPSPKDLADLDGWRHD
ncbi:hypothetical protein I350_00240 [Cryptococcus amylolentus CBS 6273]|uniref:FAD dependent oxidoreductase domain-containing protein n=1 Tax=Cryptococcus amylolentus CBS 6273 TaxID=1296118 RepID=A0A1E3KEE6_9TREE|nr:hypothetical protein I350_00240 [Cryptococcus amylolentus CBS 6273]